MPKTEGVLLLAGLPYALPGFPFFSDLTVAHLFSDDDEGFAVVQFRQAIFICTLDRSQL